MVLPFVLGVAVQGAQAHVHHAGSLSPALSAGLLATMLHTASYLFVAGALAWIVYWKLGLRLLRTAWLNLNLTWAAALVITALITPLL